MDFASAFGAVGQATTIVKALRGIEKEYDLSTVRAQMAEVYSALADVKIALADAREEIHKRDQRIKELEEGPRKLPGEPCPFCGEQAMRMTLQQMNGQWEVWTCGACTKTKEVRHDLIGTGRRR
jgi:transcription elongation factor Elf1